eukprot:scaffold42615_cov55-Attheya_sp.AAC.2
MMTQDGRTTTNRMFLWMLLLVWSGSTAQGKVTSFLPQKTQPSWKQNLELRRAANHENNGHLRSNNVRRMQHDKDLDEVDFEDPDAISQPPSVSLEPSATPTKRPTDTPTKTPTRAPTASPTHSPTAKPTADPTSSPTTSPSQSPTRAPTASPTQSPTAKPTAVPTSSPSATPSTIPTSSPSASPSQSPSARPSLSFMPSIESSEAPSLSLVPSISPTGTPSSGPTIDCTSDETGSFGVTNTSSITNETTSITVNYYYELETSTVDAQVIQTSILPAIEIAISDLIIALLFNDRSDECAARLETDVNLRQRQLQQLQQERRKLEVVGVSGSPPDVIYEDGECQIGGQDLLEPSSSSDNTTTTTTTTTNSSTNIFQCLIKACSVVEGELTLFVETANVKGDEEERVKTLIREGMEQGFFVTAHVNICQLYYIDNFEDQYVTAEEDNEGGFVQDIVDQFGIIPLAIVAAAIAMVCFLCIALCLCLRRRKNEDDEDDDDESMSSSSSFADHPLSIHTTTDSLLNNATPTQTQPTSSLDINKGEDGYGSA